MRCQISGYLHSLSWFSLHLPMEGWPGWVDLGVWLHTRDSLPAWRLSPILALTGARHRVSELIETNALPLKLFFFCDVACYIWDCWHFRCRRTRTLWPSRDLWQRIDIPYSTDMILTFCCHFHWSFVTLTTQCSRSRNLCLQWLVFCHVNNSAELSPSQLCCFPRMFSFSLLHPPVSGKENKGPVYCVMKWLPFSQSHEIVTEQFWVFAVLIMWWNFIKTVEKSDRFINLRILVTEIAIIDMVMNRPPYKMWSK